MSDNATTYRSDRETEREQPARVEAYADRLLDDLFEEVDRSLDRTRSLPEEPFVPPTVSLKPLQIPQIVVRPQVAPPPPESVKPRSGEAKDSDDRAGQLFDRLLLGAACTFLAAALGLAVWSRSEGRSFSQLFASDAEPASEAEAIPIDPEAQARSEFINYMARSLETIERDNAPTETVATTSPAVPQTPLTLGGRSPATLTVPIDPTSLDSMAASLGQIAASLEAGSISALQPPPLPLPPTATPTPQPSPNVSVPNIGAPVPPRLSTERPTRPTPTPTPSAATAVPPTPPPRPQADKPEETPEPSAATATPAPEPEPIHELIGILELGERSAALFTIEDVSRRIYIGERIGASGWTLVSVGNERVTIRRNGEVRTIFINQRF